MANFSGAAQGFLDFTQQQQQRQMQQAYLAKMQQDQQMARWTQDQKAQALQRSLSARTGAGQVMYDQMGTPPQPPMPGASSPGGTPNGGPPPQPGGQPGGMPPGPGMMPPPPGAGAPPGGPQMSPAPQQPPQPMPWRPMPQAQAGGAPAPGGPPQIGAPPGQPAPAPGGDAAPGGIAQPKPFDLKSIIGTLQKQGVPPDKVMDMLDEMTPIMNANNKAELEQFKVQHQLQGDVLKYAQERVRELQGDKRLKIAEDEHERKVADDKSKADARTSHNEQVKAKLEAKLHGAVGGKDNLKRTDFEKDADGNITGVVGITKSGKIIRKNLAGEDVAGDVKQSPKADQNRLRQVNSWRSELTTLINEANPKNKDRISALKAKISGADKPAAGGAPAAGGDVAAKVKAAGGTYEPDKYDYRVNPTTGQVEKKAKGG